MKIVLCGDGGVGKTVLRDRYLGRGFQTKYMMTIGADFALKEATVDNNKIRFQIWDLAGQQRFANVRAVYYTGCLGGLLLFDVTRRDSFENCTNWIKEIWKHNGRGVIPIVLLGNKADLRDSHPDAITSDVAKKFAMELSDQTRPHGFDIHYLDTSAKTGQNVVEAFDELGRVYFSFIEKLKK